MSAAEKQHPATEQKLKKARKEGQVARSPIFTQSLQLVGILLGTIGAIDLFWSSPEMLLQYREEFNVEGVVQYLANWGSILVKTTVMVLLAGLAGTILGELSQVGILISIKPLNIDMKRINPASGFKKLFKGIKDIWLTILKFATGILAALFIIKIYIYHAPLWISYPSILMISEIKLMFFRFSLLTAAAFFTIALIERLYRKAEFLKEQRMTHQELKEEMKNNEGDPMIKGHQRSIREQLAFGELPKRVRQARVVIVQKASEGKKV